MLPSFFWQFSVIFVTIFSSTTSKDLSPRVNKLDTLLLDGDGAESSKIGESGMATSWGEVFKERPEVLLASRGQCPTNPNKKSANRRRNDASCEVEQIEQKKPPVQQQVNQGLGKGGSSQIEENVNWAPKWDILLYGTPEDLYCAEDDSQRVLVCAQDVDWRNMKLPDGTPATFPTTIEWCSPYDYMYPCNTAGGLWCCGTIERPLTRPPGSPVDMPYLTGLKVFPTTDMVAGTFFDLIPIYGVLVLTGKPNNTQLSIMAKLGVVIAVVLSAATVRLV